MDFGFLVKRVFAILSRPREEWQVIKAEKTTVEELFARYAVILAALPALAGFVGYQLMGRLTPEGMLPVTLSENLRWMVVSYTMSLGSVYLLALVVDYLAPFFGSRKDLAESTKVVVYSHTASWLSGVFLIFPKLMPIALLAGMYSLYLLYIGLRTIKEIRPERMTGYFAAVIIASIILSFAILLLAGIFLGDAMGGPLGTEG